jgi:hypothetical protein
MSGNTSKSADIPRYLRYKADVQKEKGSLGVLGKPEKKWWLTRSYSGFPYAPRETIGRQSFVEPTAFCMTEWCECVAAGYVQDVRISTGSARSSIRPISVLTNL